MPNTILTPDEITREALRIFHTKCVMVRNANRQYDSRFAQSGAKIGDSLRVRLPNKFKVYDGATYAGGGSADTLTEQASTLSVTSRKHVPFTVSQSDLTLDLDTFSKRIIEPMVSTLAANVDLDVYTSIYKKVGQSVGSPGTTPGTPRVLLQAGQKLNFAAVPQGRRVAIIDPAANVEMIDGMKGLFHASDPLESQFREGMVASNILGFEAIEMSQNVKNHTNGTFGAGPHSTGENMVNGMTEIDLAGFGNNQTGAVKAGDVFTIAGVYSVNPETKQSTGQLMQFVATADANSDGTGVATVSISPTIYDGTTGLALQNVSGLVNSGVTVTFVGSSATSYAQNIAYHRDELLFVTADLEMPRGTHMAAREVMDGVSMLLVGDYDITSAAFKYRLDVLYGCQLPRPEAAVRIWGA